MEVTDKSLEDFKKKHPNGMRVTLYDSGDPNTRKPIGTALMTIS